MVLRLFAASLNKYTLLENTTVTRCNLKLITGLLTMQKQFALIGAAGYIAPQAPESNS
jgi:hypothetical protein